MKYNRFPSVGALFVWKWQSLTLFNSDGSSVEESSEEESSDPEPQQSSHSARGATHSITFKCIGATKSQDYQRALRKGRDILRSGQAVPVAIVHEPSNPRDSKALAFVCTLEDKKHTIGYIIREVLDEVHLAISNGSIVSVKVAWIRYITDWTRSGPGFFAGINIEIFGRWSANAASHASTR